MSKGELESKIEKEITETDARNEAVKALIRVESKHKKIDTDVELKTDLTDNSIKRHSVLQVLDKHLGGTVLASLINTMERKLISKDRKSRQEIVEVARNPDTNIVQDAQNTSKIKRFFTSRKPINPQ